jgi:hypothetical protein
MKRQTGAHYEIAVDGKPRTHRDTKPIAIEAAVYLKTKSPNAEVTVRDVESGEVTVVRHPQAR